MQDAGLIERLEMVPIIAAIKSDHDLEMVLNSECEAVFILYGTILNIGKIIETVRESGKLAFVHVDLVDGLNPREAAIDFLCENTKLDGIISTKRQIVKYSKSKGLLTVQRFFLLDSIALVNIQKQLDFDNADMIEILPGVMPKVLKIIASLSKKPIIAGGLILDKEDVVAALSSGAIAVSSSDYDIWNL